MQIGFGFFTGLFEKYLLTGFSRFEKNIVWGGKICCRNFNPKEVRNLSFKVTVYFHTPDNRNFESNLIHFKHVI
jgi:hypothetical protein